MVIDAVARMSRDDEPTANVNVPVWMTQLCDATSHVENVRSLRGKDTAADWPGMSRTFWKPFSCCGGSPAAEGKPTYSWATSDPSRLPVLVTAQLEDAVGQRGGREGGWSKAPGEQT